MARIKTHVTKKTQRQASSRMGLSLVEVVISAAILGTIGVISLQGVAAMHRSHMDTVDAARADLLARDLMDEILLHSFSITAETDMAAVITTRKTFNSISDYDNWNADGSLPVQDKNGDPLEVGSGWARRITVKNVSNNNVALLAAFNDTRIKKIAVTVSRFGKDLKSVTTIRSLAWKSAQTLE